MFKKGTDKHVNKIPDSPSQYEIQKKMPFLELFVLIEDYQCNWKIATKRASKNINTGWNDKIVVLKKTTLQLYFIEKINSGNLIM